MCFTSKFKNLKISIKRIKIRLKNSNLFFLKKSLLFSKNSTCTCLKSRLRSFTMNWTILLRYQLHRSIRIGSLLLIKCVKKPTDRQVQEQVQEWYWLICFRSTKSMKLTFIKNLQEKLLKLSINKICWIISIMILNSLKVQLKPLFQVISDVLTENDVNKK